MGRRTVKGKRAKAPEAERQVQALDTVLDTSPESLGDSYDLLRLLGAVVGQITLLDVAGKSVDDKARTSASRALIRLDEDPAAIADRLRSSKFQGLDTASLRAMVEEITEGKDPKRALDDALRRTKVKAV
jgi:hypothetical protein